MKNKTVANISLMFTELPMLHRPAAAIAAGFDAVEVQFPYDWPVDEWANALGGQGIDLHLLNLPAGDLMQGGPGIASVPSRKKDVLLALDQAEAYVAELSPKCVNVLPGLLTLDRATCEATLMDNLVLVAERLETYGCVVTFEAINTFDMPDFLIHNTAQMERIQQQIDQPNIRMQYDIYHMARMGEDVTNDIARLGDRIGHIQFADTPDRHEPGSGGLDFSQIFAAIERSAYQGALAAEYKPLSDTKSSLAWLKKRRLKGS